jgi:hypothetical protein
MLLSCRGNELLLMLLLDERMTLDVAIGEGLVEAVVVSHLVVCGWKSRLKDKDGNSNIIETSVDRHLYDVSIHPALLTYTHTWVRRGNEAAAQQRRSWRLL